MTTNELREQLLDEIRRIPDARVAEMFDLVHFFRVGLESTGPCGPAAPDVMTFAGAWSDMPEDLFASLESEWRERRHRAFDRRRDHESDAH